MILARWQGLVLFSKNSIISTNSIMLNTIWVEHRKHEILMNSALKIKRNFTLIRKTGIIKQKQCSKHLWVERQKHEILMKSAFWTVYDANMSLVREFSFKIAKTLHSEEAVFVNSIPGKHLLVLVVYENLIRIHEITIYSHWTEISRRQIG